MTIENFVNFLTPKIDAAVINSYLEENPSALSGSDNSTGGYTKFAWTLIVAAKMEENGELTEDVKDAINTYALTEVASEAIADNLSVDGLNLTQMLVLYKSGNSTYDLSDILTVWPAISTRLISQTRDTEAANILSIAAATRSYGVLKSLADRIVDSGDVGVFHSYTSREPSAFLVALRAYMNGDDLMLPALRTLAATVEGGAYGALPVDGELTKLVENKLVSQLCSGTYDSFVRAISVDEVKDLIEAEDASSYSRKTVVSSNGLDQGDNLYSGGEFPSYGFAHLLMMSYGLDLAKDIDTIAFLPSISDPLSCGDLDGINFHSIYCEHASLGTSGEWNIPPRTADIGGVASAFDSYAIYGSVRDFTNGRKVNHYGSANLILSAFFDYHQILYNDSDKSVGANSLPGIEASFNALVPQFIVGMDFAFYISWCTHFNKEIT